MYSKCSYLYTDIWIELQIYASEIPQLKWTETWYEASMEDPL
jgi:hypothetical protein